jgi:hypothetical protein
VEDGSSVSIAIPSSFFPATGSTLVASTVAGRTPTDVKVTVFSTSQRKLKEQIFPKVLPGSAVVLDLVDRTMTPLANGLYYVVVTIDQKRTVLKLLILH